MDAEDAPERKNAATDLLQRHKQLCHREFNEVKLLYPDDVYDVLYRKLEHCQLDVNILRDAVYEHDRCVDDPNGAQHCLGSAACRNQIKLLFSEVEGIRLLLRRVDVNGCKDKNLYKNISNLTRQMKVLGDMCTDILSGSLLNQLRQEFNDDIGKIKHFVDDSINLLHKQEEANQKTARKFNEDIFELFGAVSDVLGRAKSNLSEIECIKEGVCSRTALYGGHFRRLFHATGAYSAARFCASVGRAVRSHNLRRCAAALEVWLEKNRTSIENDSDQQLSSDISCRSVSDVIFKMISRLPYGRKKITARFVRWRENVRYKVGVEKLRASRHIYPLRDWVRLATVSEYPAFRHWKRATVEDRIREETVATELVYSGTVLMSAQDRKNVSDKKIKNLQINLSILQNDTNCQLKVLGDYLANMTNNQFTMDEICNKLRWDVTNQFKAMNKLKQDFKEMIAEANELTQTSIINYKRSVDKEFTSVRETVAREVDDINFKFKLIETKFLDVKKEVIRIDETFCTQDNKLDRILLLQGKINERLDKMEQNNFEGVDTMMESTKLVKAATLDIAICKVDLKKRIDDVSAHVPQLERDVRKDIMGLQSDIGRGLADISELQARDRKFKAGEWAGVISAIDALSDKVGILYANEKLAVEDPTPLDLFRVYVEFEKHLLDSSLAHMSNPNVEGALVTRALSSFASRLAAFVSANADTEVLTHVIGVDGEDKQRDVLNENALARRQFLLDDFYKEFTLLLKQEDEKNSAPGLSKTNIRVVFHRRFINAMNLAMNKISGIVVPTTGSSAITFPLSTKRHANPLAASCLLCNNVVTSNNTSASPGKISKSDKVSSVLLQNVLNELNSNNNKKVLNPIIPRNTTGILNQSKFNMYREMNNAMSFDDSFVSDFEKDVVDIDENNARPSTTNSITTSKLASIRKVSDLLYPPDIEGPNNFESRSFRKI